MSQAGVRERTLEYLRQHYPSLREVSDLAPRFQNIISEKVVKLPSSALTRVEKAVKDIYAFAHSPAWLTELAPRLDSHLLEVFETQAPPSSVLMSYDFHYDFSTDQLSLIEINTNASMFLLTAALYEVHGVRSSTMSAPLEALHQAFVSEWGTVTPKSLAMVDVDPPAQKMYLEFLMYCDLFRKWGVASPKIFDIAALNVKDFNFIYNRLTDFYLSEPESRELWRAWHSGKKVLSPHPREYLLLADKQRLIDFSLRKVSEVLIPTMHVSSVPRDELWAQRKSLFFKPKNAFGAKAAYRGSSVRNKAFDELVAKDYVAQEYREPGVFEDYKFDLRFFAYKDSVQLVCARLYQGQVTNFAALGGGVAPVVFESSSQNAPPTSTFI